jgi:hypothetical protein
VLLKATAVSFFGTPTNRNKIRNGSRQRFDGAVVRPIDMPAACSFKTAAIRDGCAFVSAGSARGSKTRRRSRQIPFQPIADLL